jgi:hypothetical protein
MPPWQTWAKGDVHVSPLQHGSLKSPQGSHMPPWQRKPGEHVLPLQHGSPELPQAIPVVVVTAPVVVVVVVLVVPQTFAVPPPPHVAGAMQVPQLIVPPQPSNAVPQS